MGRPGCIDEQIRGRFAAYRVPRHDERLDVRTEAVRDMTRRFQMLFCPEAIRVTDLQERRVCGMRRQVVQLNGAFGSGERASVSDPVAERGRGGRRRRVAARIYDRARRVAEAELRFPESGFELTLRRREEFSATASIAAGSPFVAPASASSPDAPTIPAIGRRSAS